MKKLIEIFKTYYKKYKEIVNYLIVGGLTTVISLSVYYLSVIEINSKYIFLNPNNGFQLQIANILSWTVGVIFAYFTNRKFVFESKETNKLKEAGSFVLSRLVTLFMDMAIMFLGVSVLHRKW